MSKPSRSPQQLTIEKKSLYLGPVPDPDALQRYEQIQPGFADRLITMAEKEQISRHKAQEDLISNDHKQHKREIDTYRIGQICAVITVLIVVGLCVYGFYLGYKEEAAAIAKVVIVSLAGAFLLRKAILRPKAESGKS